jgi:uncharacterized protein YcbK (DUF882 family)
MRAPGLTGCALLLAALASSMSALAAQQTDLLGSPALRLGSAFESTLHSTGLAAGRSGRLRTHMVMPGQRLRLGVDLEALSGTGAQYRWVDSAESHATGLQPVPAGMGELLAPSVSGTYALEIQRGSDREAVPGFRLIVLVPLSEAARGKLNGYHMGAYPVASGQARYAAPKGLIEVRPHNADLRLSRHFTLKEFLTHDQPRVWPKYVYVDPRLLDKLELVMADLSARGMRAEHMVVMSGFRTPQYNRQGLSSGRATLSRHQYGDAADVWVDSDRDGYIDDLNGDGRRNILDARVILESVERVERAYPELVGGAGIYRDNGAHGPFIHIDVRGRRARW